jgi:TolA-binding protein
MPKSALMLTMAVLLAAAAQAAPKQYNDNVERDLVRRIQTKRDPTERLALIRYWMQKYPHTEFSQDRFQMLLLAEQSLGEAKEMRATARAMALDDPEGLGNYWICLLVVAERDDSPKGLDEAVRAARTILRDPQESRQDTVAHRALGWAAMSREQWQTAQQEFRTVLKRDPGDAESTYWLGNCILRENNPATMNAAFYYFARAYSIKGSKQLTPDLKAKLRDYLKNTCQETRTAALLKRAASVRAPRDIPNVSNCLCCVPSK